MIWGIRIGLLLVGSAVVWALVWFDLSPCWMPASFYDEVEAQIEHDESCAEYDWGDGPCTCWAKDLRAFCEEHRG